MKSCPAIAVAALVVSLSLGLVMGQSPAIRGDNAASWYRAAFVQIIEPDHLLLYRRTG